MNFEDAYQKLREGTATDEEAAFVARELENVRKISAILDHPDLSDPGIQKAEAETVEKADPYGYHCSVQSSGDCCHRLRDPVYPCQHFCIRKAENQQGRGSCGGL